MFNFKVNFFVNLGGRKNVVTDGNVVDEDALKFVCLSAKNFIFLECLQIVNCIVTDDSAFFWGRLVLALFEGEFRKGTCCVLDAGVSACRRLEGLLLPVDKLYGVGVDDAVTLTLNFKVVGNQVNRTALNERV